MTWPYQVLELTSLDCLAKPRLDSGVQEKSSRTEKGHGGSVIIYKSQFLAQQGALSGGDWLSD